MTTTPQATIDITTDEQADQVRNRIPAFRQRLTTVAADRAAVSDQIGQALAQVETGNVKAKAAADRLRAHRAALLTEQDDLDSTLTVLQAAVQAWDQEAMTRRADQALIDLPRLETEAREVEAAYADHLIAAAALADRLDACRSAFARARNTAHRGGRFRETDAFSRPRMPFGLHAFARTEAAARREVARWFGQRVSPPPLNDRLAACGPGDPEGPLPPPGKPLKVIIAPIDGMGGKTTKVAEYQP